MSDMKTEPLRLDRALEELSASAAIDAGTEAQLLRFEAVIEARTRLRLAFAPPNLVDEVFEFIMPLIGNPDILRGSRYVGLLEEIAGALDESAGASGEIERTAAAALREELRKHRLLRQQINGLTGR